MHGKLGRGGAPIHLRTREWWDSRGHSAVDRLTIFRLPRLTAVGGWDENEQAKFVYDWWGCAFGLALFGSARQPRQGPKAGGLDGGALQQKIDELQAKLQAQLESQQALKRQNSLSRTRSRSRRRPSSRRNQDPAQTEVLPRVAADDLNIPDQRRTAPAWLGVETMK